jgi:broad specificity phosphatase PhoE
MNFPSGEDSSVIVVARHGERLDYYVRDYPDFAKGETNWVATAPRPFDPPLTSHGQKQAVKLGQHLVSELSKLGLPRISEIYTSPLLRCRQTAGGARDGLVEDAQTIPVRVEPGLMESINEYWYRSWALPGSDGSWGYGIDDDMAYDVETVHALAKQPVQTLLEEWKSDQRLDHSHITKTSIVEPYCFYPPHLETSSQQADRLKQVVSSTSQPGKTVLLVSHGGPVTHLYEMLTGNNWYVHGEATYCSYSIYKKKRTGTDYTWEPIQANQSNYLKETHRGGEYIYGCF